MIDEFYDDDYDYEEDFFDERQFSYRPSPLVILILLLLILAMLLPFLNPMVSTWIYHQSPTPTPEPSFWEEKEVAKAINLRSDNSLRHVMLSQRRSIHSNIRFEIPSKRLGSAKLALPARQALHSGFCHHYMSRLTLIVGCEDRNSPV
ncbi:hypothetical protein QUF58_02120 [Anaerolineales bacterium HSG24]|nr:hypothetical protein [Anaerolineales bacterium HSG24]